MRDIPLARVATSLIGRMLFKCCSSMPRIKRPLRPLGLRTWHKFQFEHPVRVPLERGNHLRLLNVQKNYLTFQLFWRGSLYYEPITRLIIEHISTDDTLFIDVGANMGFFSLTLAVARPRVRVLAFEPNPNVYNMLAQNVMLNGLAGRVQCEPMALSSEEATRRLYLHTSDMSASLEPDFQAGINARHEVVTVPTVTLDGYLRKHCPANRYVIKVDIEGHENAFFTGALQTIRALTPDIIVEVLETTTIAVLPELRALGYYFYGITNEGLLESKELKLNKRGSLTFLNYLLTRKDPLEAAKLFEQIRPTIANINWKDTSKYFEERNR